MEDVPLQPEFSQSTCEISIGTTVYKQGTEVSGRPLLKRGKAQGGIGLIQGLSQ